MLSYLHAFHAGGWPDVVKHATLALLVRGLQRKSTPFAYVETHAGRGLYDLESVAARKLGEHKAGIARIGLHPTDAPPEAASYFDAVRAENPSGAIRFYPGSPRIVRHLLRPGDRMALAELHPAEHPALRRLFARDKQVGVHHVDGYQIVKSLLPPPERRGLVFIDPSFEVKREYDDAASAMVAAHRRFPGGITVLWYPVLAAGQWRDLLLALTKSGVRKLLRVELCVRAADVPGQINGSGLIVQNPPWRFDEQVSRLLPWLATRLADPDANASTTIEWLVPDD